MANPFLMYLAYWWTFTTDTDYRSYKNVYLAIVRSSFSVLKPIVLSQIGSHECCMNIIEFGYSFVLVSSWISVSTIRRSILFCLNVSSASKFVPFKNTSSRIDEWQIFQFWNQWGVKIILNVHLKQFDNAAAGIDWPYSNHICRPGAEVTNQFLCTIITILK